MATTGNGDAPEGHPDDPALRSILDRAHAAADRLDEKKKRYHDPREGKHGGMHEKRPRHKKGK